MIKLNNGRCILMHGDNSKLFKSIKDGYIDLTITSPPYDDLRQYNGYSFNFEIVANDLYRVTKVGGIVVWVVADKTYKGSESGTSFKQALYFKQIGFNLHDTMIWQKPRILPQEQHPRYNPSFEYMFVFCKGYPPKTFNPLQEPNIQAGRTTTFSGQRNNDNTFRHGNGIDAKLITVKPTRNLRNVWNIDINQNSHPAPFPEKLAEDHILSWSNPGDIVLDPMMGSGTTGKMAILNNRRFIGMDCSEQYVNIAAQRIEQSLTNPINASTDF